MSRGRELEEAEETLRAIRAFEVDAVVASGPDGDRVYTLSGADRPYQRVIEAMQEGAVTLSREGDILFCNACFARMVGVPIERLRGHGIRPHVAAGSTAAFEALLAEGAERPAHGELLLRGGEGATLPVSAALSPLPLDGEALGAICVLLTDLSIQRRREDESKLLQVLALGVSQAETLDDALTLVLKTVCGFTGWELGQAWLPAGAGLQRRVFYCLDPVLGAAVQARKERIIAPCVCTKFRAWRDRVPVIVPEIAAEPECSHRDEALQLGFLAGVHFPVVAAGDVVAVVAFLRTSTEAPDARLLDVVTAVAAQLGPVILRRQMEERVAAQLREKDLLLKELHHRVKNNLMVISSLIGLQARRVRDAGTRQALAESEGRIQTMALAHEALHRNPDLARVPFAAYVARLAEHIALAWGLERRGVRLEVSVDPGIRLGLEAANPFGLLLHEVVTNAVKHAFPGGRSGLVSVSLTPEAADTLLFVVRDDGVGFGTATPAVPTLGMELVHTLVGQLDGAIDIDTGPTGTCVRVRFSAPAAAPVG